MPSQTFKAPSPLQPVGFGAPDLNYALTPQVANQLQPISAPDTTGLQILGKAGDALQQTLQQESQSNKQEEQAQVQIAQQQAAQQAAITQTSMASIQARASANASSSDSWGKVANTALGMVDRVQKVAEQEEKRRAAEAAAALKAELEQNQLKATTELENLQVQWIEGGLIDKQGTLAYRKAVGETLSKYRMEPDTIGSLTAKYYTPALDFAKRVSANQVKKSEDAIVAQRDIALQESSLELGAAVAGMKMADIGSRDAAFAKFNEVLAAVEQNPKLDELSKMIVQGNLLKLAVGASGVGEEERSKIKQLQDYNTETQDYYNQMAPLVNSGEATADQYTNGWNTIRAKYGKEPQEGPSTLRNLKAQEENDSLTLKIEKNASTRIQNNVDRIPMNEASTNALAITMSLNPTNKELLKQLIKDGKADKNTRAAVALSDEFDAFKNNVTPAFRAESDARATRLMTLQKAGIDEIIQMQSATTGGGGGQSADNFVASLRALGIAGETGGPPPTPVAKYTPQQIAAVDAARAQVFASIQREEKTSQDAYNAKEDEFKKRGLYLNGNLSREALAKYKPAIEQHNRAVEQANSAPQLSPSATGQQSNFSSGMSRKPAVAPLVKTSYGGKTITTPFDIKIGPLEKGQAFHDNRPGRQHDGLDFATPMGTPIKSLVSGVVVANDVSDTGYGRAVQIQGDDGFTYFFAHLSKQLLPVGGKVGAGETLGLSGNTGVGSGPHMHLEVWANKPGDANPTGTEMIDPLMHLSTREFGDKAPMMRSADGRPPAQGLIIPPGAIALGGGTYLLNGRVGGGGQPNVEAATRTSTGAPGVDVFALPTAGADPTGNIPAKKGLELVGYVNTYKSTSDKTIGVATYRNKAGGLLTLTIPAPKNKKAQVPDSFGFDGRGFQPSQAVKKTVPAQMSFNSYQPTGQGQGQGGAQTISGVSMPPEIAAFIEMFRDGEGTVGDKGYTTMFTGKQFSGFKDHPRKVQEANGLRSDAAGMGQFLSTTWDGVRNQLNLPDFSPNSQVKGIIQLIKNEGAYDDVMAGRMDSALSKLSNVWASLPTGVNSTIGRYGQPNKTGAQVVQSYRQKLAGMRGGTTPTTSSGGTNVVAQRVLKEALSREGKSFSPELEAQCANFVRDVLAKAGVNVGVTKNPLDKQFDTGTAMANSFFGADIGEVIKDRNQLQPGDLVALANTYGNWGPDVITHVGIYIGNGQVIDRTTASLGPSRKRKLTEWDKPGGGFRYGVRPSAYGSNVAPNTPKSAVQQLPPGAIRVGPNNYLDQQTGTIKVGSVYNSSSPFQPSYAPMSAVAYAAIPADSRDDFGYSQLKDDAKIRDGVHGLAEKHGIPAQWVADAAMLKGTSGIDGNELEEMDELLSRQKRTPKTTQQFITAVLPGMDAKEANLALGIHGGRRYDSTFAALLRAQAPTHERHTKNCTLCNQLTGQEVFTPHKAESIA